MGHSNVYFLCTDNDTIFGHENCSSIYHQMQIDTDRRGRFSSKQELGGCPDRPDQKNQVKSACI